MQKKYQYYDSTLVEQRFKEYKANPSKDRLALLYLSVDPVILSVLQRASKNFRHKHPEDFDDLVQSVKMDIFKILEKLVSISETGNQVLSIVIKASTWSFKTNYRLLKKQRSVSFEYMSEVISQKVSAQEKEDFTVGHEVDFVSGHDFVSIPVDFDVSLLSLISTPPNQFACSFLKSLPSGIAQTALLKNRYKDKELILKFCIECYLQGRSPSSMLISKRWGVSNANFWIKYSFILLKLSILNVYKGVKNEEKTKR